MSNRYNQGTHFSGATRFVQTPMAEVEFSKMVSPCRVLTDMNAGDIVPVLCLETLPHSTFTIDFNYVNRLLSALVAPVMGDLVFDVFAFHCPTRVVNESWRNVLGENTSGFWSAPEVDLAPLYKASEGPLRVPVGSIADYYDLPTQLYINAEVLAQMSDTIPRQYFEIINTYFRDQNYQPPYSYSKLNIYNGFLSDENIITNSFSTASAVSDGSVGAGALTKALFGEGSIGQASVTINTYNRGRYSFLNKPIKANKLHDAFTSVLPSPQKGSDVTFSFAGNAPVTFSIGDYQKFDGSGVTNGGLNLLTGNSLNSGQYRNLTLSGAGGGPFGMGVNSLKVGIESDGDYPDGANNFIGGWNLNAVADLAASGGISINDLRSAIATQQVLELLARGGSRYWSFLKSFFGVEVDDPFPDIPTQIGHYRSTLDMYQVAQTSQSTVDSAQGSLAAFGYTTNGSGLFTKTFIEHGFIHIFAVIRHKSIYPAYTPPHWFKRKTMDFYLPQFANISEQPIRTAVLNPFNTVGDPLGTAVGYQEAWWDYRYDPDRLHGLCRSFVAGETEYQSLDVWHFGNKLDTDFQTVDGDWLISDTQEILDRCLRLPSEIAPQFICQFDFKITKQLPMPVYSIPGLDTI